MGIKIKDIIEPKSIDISELSNKVLAIDSFNLLYQFLTTIRQPDGTPLQDKNGNVTSHLVGLFSRTTKLMQKKIKFVFVFDGTVPDLKNEERKRRNDLKKEAEEKYKIAVELKDIDEMKKYASRINRLTPEMVEEAKELISALGIPIVNAPSEGEAQASYMAKKGDVYATVSQDGDSLMFGTPRLIRNLSLTQRKKAQNKLAYEKNSAEIISLDITLRELNFNIDQLIIYAILVGTDYNIGGVKGIGPKTAVKLVSEYKDNYDKLFEEVKWSDYFDYSWNLVFDTIKNMKVTDDYDLKWTSPNFEKIKELLVDKHNFSIDRINYVLNELSSAIDVKQKGLNDFF
jgi:flap endonuclease-1